MYSNVRMIRKSEDVQGMRSHSLSLTFYPTVRTGVRSAPYDLKY